MKRPFLRLLQNRSIVVLLLVRFSAIAFQSQSQTSHRQSHQKIFSRESARLNVWLSNQAALAAGVSDSFESMVEEDDQPLEGTSSLVSSRLLSYLPLDSINVIPPLTEQFLVNITNSFIDKDSIITSTKKQVETVIEQEHRLRVAPVEIGSLSIDAASDSVEEQLFTNVLAFAALYRLPREVTSGLLDTVWPGKNSTVSRYVDTFRTEGWDAVSFPKGLPVRSLPEYRRPSVEGSVPRWFRYKRRRIREGQVAVEEASRTKPPFKRLKSRQEFLASIEEELTDLPSVAITEKQNGLFFPNSVPLKGFSLRRIKSVAKEKYGFLKQKGQAGFLSYCFFNFLYYTAGMLWQWNRIPSGDPIAASSTAVMIVARKFGRVFGSLYVASQLIKLPKLFGAVALVPISERVLRFTSRRLKVNETIATIAVVVLLYATWLGAVGVPVLSDYARLRQLVHMDEHLLQMYGLQPV